MITLSLIFFFKSIVYNNNFKSCFLPTNKNQRSTESSLYIESIGSLSLQQCIKSVLRKNNLFILLFVPSNWAHLMVDQSNKKFQFKRFFVIDWGLSVSSQC